MRPFFSDRDWKKLPQSGRQAVSDVALQMIWEDVSDAIKAGHVRGARRPPPFAQRRSTLDDDGLEGGRPTLLERALDETEKIQARSAERIKVLGGTSGCGPAVVADALRVGLGDAREPKAEEARRFQPARSCSGVLEQNVAADWYNS